MGNIFQEMLVKQVAADKRLLKKAIDADCIAIACNAFAGCEPPHPQVIRYANAMCTIQLGEAVKELIADNIMDKREILGEYISAGMLSGVRDDLAHADREIANDDVTDALAKEKGVLLQTFYALQERYPENASVASCIDALSKTSRGESLPVLWEDAENYMHVVRGSCLESLSPQAQKIINAHTGGLVHKLVTRRNDLCHDYQKNRTQGQGVSVDDELSDNMELLSPEKYRKEILGQRRDTQIENILREWMDPASGSQAPGYTIQGCRIVAEEFSALAKKGASSESIALLHEALMGARRGQRGAAAFMAAAFPDGLGGEMVGSFQRLDEAARNNAWMQKKGTTGVFAAALTTLQDAADANRLAQEQREQALRAIRTSHLRKRSPDADSSPQPN
jgi:hypothetical protein